jgi:hypothetical protein
VNYEQYPQISFVFETAGPLYIEESSNTDSAIGLLGLKGSYKIDSSFTTNNQVAVFHLYDFRKNRNEKTDSVIDHLIKNSGLLIADSIIARDVIYGNWSDRIQYIHEIGLDSSASFDTLDYLFTREDFDTLEISVSIKSSSGKAGLAELISDKLFIQNDSTADLHLQPSVQSDFDSYLAQQQVFVNRVNLNVISRMQYDSLPGVNEIQVCSRYSEVTRDSLERALLKEEEAEFFGRVSDSIIAPAIVLFDSLDGLRSSLIVKYRTTDDIVFYSENGELKKGFICEKVVFNKDSFESCIRNIRDRHTNGNCQLYVSLTSPAGTLNQTDSLFLILESDTILGVEIQVPAKVFEGHVLSSTIEAVNFHLELPDFQRSIALLRQAVQEYEPFSAVNSKRFSCFTDSVLAVYCRDSLITGLSIAFQQLEELDREWSSYTGIQYNRERKRLLNHLLLNAWVDNDYYEVIRIAQYFIGKYGESDTVNEKLYYSLSRTQGSNIRRLCDYLKKCYLIRPDIYSDEYTTCLENAMEELFVAGKFEEVFLYGKENLKLIRQRPYAWYQFAESGYKTGKYKDVYPAYLWFFDNLSKVDMALDFEACLERIREISFHTGDYLKAYELELRRYLNTDRRSDLFKAISAYRLRYAALIATSINLSVVHSETVLSDKGFFLPNYYKEFKIISDVQSAKNYQYPKTISSFPYAGFNAMEKTAGQITRIGQNKFLAITIDASKVHQPGEQFFIALLQSGYHKEVFDRFIAAEEEEGLRFFGSVLKHLAGEIVTNEQSDLITFFRSLQNTSEVEYIAYSVEDEEICVGKCPGKDAYSPDYYEGSVRVIQHVGTTLVFNNMTIDEIAVPLKRSGKRIGYIRIGLKNSSDG